MTRELRDHYAETFRRHGPSPLGVDWRGLPDLELRYRKMLEVIPAGRRHRPTVLDVGCGFGGLYAYALDQGLDLRYTGIDVVPEMITHARATLPSGEFRCEDVFELPPGSRYDYVVCNGILTQKLTTSTRDMDRHAQRLIRRLHELSTVGAVFNVMTSKVDYTKDNLYHRHPAELLAWCMAEVTDRVRVDHAYPLYEYSVYLYREGVE
ncbi:class I SAM-dependent methyltransferase [Geodermatophilus maliterrae]|uniref:Trans-aconitate 2-methyltransferase n=1 Tax=Geodermatophilus maliterrae TaxID=3162531 RepID=A0ABV3XM44_9ACTN